MIHTQDRFRGCLLGLAVGDAIGAAVEFRRRGTFEPVTDMIGGGPYRLEAGQWTDDTSMALCLGSSLIESGFDLRDQIERYCRWYEEGYWSATGHCFDIGITVRRALDTYRKTGNPKAGSDDPQRAGNGCLMRLAPVPMSFFPDEERAAAGSVESASTTHQAAECLEATSLFAGILIRALRGNDRPATALPADPTRFTLPNIRALAAGDYLQKSEAEIIGSGYVVESLEAALWSFARADTFEDAVLRAANLGDDADTTAAICGQVAGAFFGADAIPPHWRQRLHRASEVQQMADTLFDKATANKPRAREAIERQRVESV